MKLRPLATSLLAASALELLGACSYDFQQFVSDGGSAGTSSAEGGRESNGGSAGSAVGSGGSNSGGSANNGGTSAGGKTSGGAASNAGSSAGGVSAGGKPSSGGSNSGGATGGSAGHASGGKSASSGGTQSSGGMQSSGGTQSSGGNGSCAGERLNGVCWYLGDVNLSCSQVCTNHGGVATAATGVVGTTSQGGSLLECTLVLALLGVREAPNEATRSDGAGLGCHTFPQETRGMQSFWLSSPEFSTSAHLRGASLACGCVQ